MSFSLTELFTDLPRIRLVDVGASPIDGDPPYAPLFATGAADLVGFEPDPEQFAALERLGLEHARFEPAAIGDGQPAILRTCRSPGMTSLFEPDKRVLEHFHGFAGWGRVVRREPIETSRLDDIESVRGADYLKLDVQGGELAVLHGATLTLEQVSVVHTEVQFVPFYREQPLFADLDQELRRAGFLFHRFQPIHSRVFQPMLVNEDIYAGLSQELWADAIYVKAFTDFDRRSEEELLKIATLLHDLYQSYDLAALALRHLDARTNAGRESRYMQALESDMLASA